MSNVDISRLFAQLIDSLEGAITQLSQKSANYFSKNNFEDGKKLVLAQTKLIEIKDEISKQEKAWLQLNLDQFEEQELQPKGQLSSRQVKVRGKRTQQSEYVIPILEALAEMNGGGNMSEVLDIVERKMAKKLTPFDYESLQSNPNTIRWKNTAKWTRYELVQQGLMSDQSENGVWEITSKGYQFLKENRTS
ncbi:MAG: hypothetical protein canaca05_09400 [Anaerolineaceae bacterium]